MSDPERTSDLPLGPVYDAVPVADGQEPPSPFAVGHRILRGRYPWAIGLGLLLGGGAAAAVWTLVPLKYRSNALIDIAPTSRVVLSQTYENQPTLMYENYVNSEVNLIASRRITDAAMESEAWRGTGRGMSDDAIGRFRSALTVEHVPGSQNIRVSFRDEDPAIATVAVNEVIDAYMKLVDEREDKSGLETANKLESQRLKVEGQLSTNREQMARVTESGGAEKLRADLSSAIELEKRLKTKAGELELEIAKRSAGGDEGAEKAETPESVALRDDAMSKLLDERAQVEARLKDLEVRQEYGPNDERVVRTRMELDVLARRIADRMKAYQSDRPDSAEARAKLLESRREELKQIQAKLLGASADTARLGKKVGELDGLEADRKALEDGLDEIKRRLEQINVESDVHGRTTVLMRGERPVGPDDDKRFPLSVVLGFVGLAVGVGLVLAWGVRDGRVRYIVDVEADSKRAKILGIVPDLGRSDAGESGADGEDVGEYCVHQVRAMLQLQSHGRSGVTVLTSPSPGAGKTTLGLALGLSYASAGARTLLVDADLIGHGLTSASQALGGPDAELDLEAKGEVPHSLLERVVEPRGTAVNGHGPRAGGTEGRAVGGTALVAGGGVMDALKGMPLQECVRPSGIHNLALLPVGRASPEDVSSLSPASVRALLEACRANYEVVLVDTGPVLGSIEAVLAAAAADRVVLVVPRGERQPLIDDALRRLERVGANVAGIVFNRATLDDVARSSYASRSASGSEALDA